MQTECKRLADPACFALARWCRQLLHAPHVLLLPLPLLLLLQLQRQCMCTCLLLFLQLQL